MKKPLSLCRLALRYAKRGWAAGPLWRKKPVAGSNGYKDFTTDPEVARRLFAEHRPHDGIGIATGRASNLLVFDVDGASGEDLLRRLERKLGALPETREASSRPGR